MGEGEIVVSLAQVTKQTLTNAQPLRGLRLVL